MSRDNLKQRELDLLERDIAMREAEAKQKKREEEAQTGLSGILPSVIGGLAGIGGMIPSLIGGPQKRQLEAIQRGGGAGASLARRTASEAGRRVVGASTAQPSSGRGGALREGLRAADRIVQQGAAQAATTGAQEGLAATQMLRANELQRRDAFRRLGAGSAQMLSSIGAMIAAGRDQGPVGMDDIGATGYGEAKGLTGDTAGMVTQTPGEQAAATESADQADVAATIEGGQRGLDRIAKAREGQVLRTSAPTGRFAEPGAIGQAMAEARGSAPDIDMSGVAARQAQNIAAQNIAQIADTTAQKQDAGARYRQAVAPDFGAMAEMPPYSPYNPEDRAQFEEWLYNQAHNYSPALKTGMSPEQVAMKLLEWGYQVDWARLGMPEGGISGGGR